MALNMRQRLFAEAYIKLGIAGQAAEEAGYSPKTADTTGSRLLKNAEVKEYIRARLREQHRDIQADADEVMAFLSRVMRGEISDQFGLDASLADRINAAKELNKRFAAADMINSNNRKVIVEFQEESWTK